MPGDPRVHHLPAGPGEPREPAGRLASGVPDEREPRPGTTVSVDVRHFRDRAVNACLTLDGRGGAGWCHALWVVPGGAAIVVLLQYAALGVPPVGVVLPGRSREPGARSALRMDGSDAPLGGGVVGMRLPPPAWAPLERPQAVAAWLRRVLDAGETPHLLTFPSSAVALCRAAQEGGLDLAGTRMSIGGEPITPARLAAIRAGGVDAAPHYGSMEVGRIGEGCLAPAASDESTSSRTCTPSCRRGRTSPALAGRRAPDLLDSADGPPRAPERLARR